MNPIKFKGDFKFDDKWFLQPEKPKKSFNYFIEKYNICILQKSKKNNDYIDFFESMQYSDIENFLFEDYNNNIPNTKLYFGKRRIFLKEHNRKIGFFMIVKENDKSIDFEFRTKSKFISEHIEDKATKNAKTKIKKDLMGIALNIIKILDY